MKNGATIEKSSPGKLRKIKKTLRETKSNSVYSFKKIFLGT